MPKNQIALLLLITFICAGCAQNPIGISSSTSSIAVGQLPTQLQPASFEGLLQCYDQLNDQQKTLSLQYLLSQTTLDDKQKAEAAYMLARLLQSTAPSQALSLFEIAKNYPPLKKNSLWHQSEVAAVLGKEKLVRQTLQDLLNETNDQPAQGAIQYALAQSYIRANETQNASELFNKIKTAFPDTDYAIGSNYYLGSLSYAQLEASHYAAPTNALLNDIRSYYFAYLQASPAGHFAQDILLKLQSLATHKLWQATEHELALMAKAYSANGQYKLSLACWQKIGPNKNLLALADCLVHLGQSSQAQQLFFQALNSNQNKEQSFLIAKEISAHLDAAQGLHFWQQLTKTKFAHQDEVIWNIAIRSGANTAVSVYQNLLKYYPQSMHAPAAQWWLLWHKLKSIKAIFWPALSNLFYQSAVKYNHSQITARFYFWAGKLAEYTHNIQQARCYYQDAVKVQGLGYYQQRAAARLECLQTNTADNFFRSNISHQSRFNSPFWNSFIPNKAIDNTKQDGNLALSELIYIKQYEEALADRKNLSSDLIAWLEGQCGRPWLAINEAVECYEDKSCLCSDKSLLLQYSYPLLYNQEITAACAKNTSVDSLLMQALIREESRYDPKAISRTGALGLCQLMPTTANGIVKITHKEQLFQPSLNISLGVSYLDYAQKSFNNDSLEAIAGYNAGINAVKNFVAVQHGRVIDPDLFVEEFPFQETRNYMRNVFSSYRNYKQIYARTDVYH